MGTKQENKLPKMEQEVEIHKDGTQTNVIQNITLKELMGNKENLNSENFLLKFHNYDPDIWEIAWAKSSVYNVQLKGGITDTYYSSRLTVRKRQSSPMCLESLATFFNQLDRKHTTVKDINLKEKKDKLMLEIPLMDPHLGKYAYSVEPGKQYNLNVCKQKLLNSTQMIINKNIKQGNKFEKVLFVFGNDFFHIDNDSKTTRHGTPQDTDGLLKQIFKVGTDLLIDMIDMLGTKLACPVDVLWVPGNHDYNTSFYALQVLQAYYRNDKTVNVIDNIEPRKYYLYGKNLIGYTHGEAEGKNIQFLMQKEAQKEWGKAIWMEWHLGHLHIEKSIEYNGLILRRIPSISLPDAWHTDKGYTGNIGRIQTFVWDKNGGNTDIQQYII